MKFCLIVSFPPSLFSHCHQTPTTWATALPWNWAVQWCFLYKVYCIHCKIRWNERVLKIPWEIFTIHSCCPEQQESVVSRKSGTQALDWGDRTYFLFTFTQRLHDKEQYLRDQGTWWSLFVNITNKTRVCIGEIYVYVHVFFVSVCTPAPLTSVHVQQGL